MMTSTAVQQSTSIRAMFCIRSPLLLIVLLLSIHQSQISSVHGRILISFPSVPIEYDDDAGMLYQSSIQLGPVVQQKRSDPKEYPLLSRAKSIIGMEAQILRQSALAGPGPLDLNPNNPIPQCFCCRAFVCRKQQCPCSKFFL